MTYIGILAYLQHAKGKKPRKAAAGQKEMLLPISDKRTANEDKKRVEKPTPARARKRA
jgi:DNA end-binding protein Ku